jgi:LacI family transcriptional regulator
MYIAKGVEDELRKYGYSMIICNSNESVSEEKNRLQLLCEKCVDGIVVIPATGDGAHYSVTKDCDIPMVLIDRLVEGFDTDAVLVDNINGSYAVIEHLINKGHRRIGFIGGDMRLTSARERYEGYKRALQDYCIPIDEAIIKFGDYHVQGGFDLMKQFAETPSAPSYVFVSNHFMHIGATKYLMQHRIGKNKDNGMKQNTEMKENTETMQSAETKQELHIASFDDMELSSLLGFCKVRVSQPMMEIGSKAAQMIISRINKEEIHFPQIIRLKTELVIESDF